MVCELCESNTDRINFASHNRFIVPYIVMHETLKYINKERVIFERFVLTNSHKLFTRMKISLYSISFPVHAYREYFSKKTIEFNGLQH